MPFPKPAPAKMANARSAKPAGKVPPKAKGNAMAAHPADRGHVTADAGNKLPKHAMHARGRNRGMY